MNARLMSSGYRNLVVWQEAKALVILVYNLTMNFPQAEMYALTSQMRRAGVSVMSQIAEGWLRKTKKHKLHYLEIAEGSLFELESLGEVALAVNYFENEMYSKFDKQRSKVSYLLYRYRSKIRS